MKKVRFSRPAMVIGFILASRVEGLTLQIFSVYTIEKLLTRPIFLVLVGIIIALLVWGLTRKSEMEFS
jgi:TctA family transporter